LMSTHVSQVPKIYSAIYFCSIICVSVRFAAVGTTAGLARNAVIIAGVSWLATGTFVLKVFISISIFNWIAFLYAANAPGLSFILNKASAFMNWISAAVITGNSAVFLNT